MKCFGHWKATCPESCRMIWECYGETDVFEEEDTPFENNVVILMEHDYRCLGDEKQDATGAVRVHVLGNGG